MKREHFVKVVEEAFDALPKDDLPAWLSGIAPTGAAILARSLQRRSAGPDTKSESPQPESVVRGVDRALWPHFDRPPCRTPAPRLIGFPVGPAVLWVPSAEHAQWVRGRSLSNFGPLDKDDAVPRARKAADGGKCEGGPGRRWTMQVSTRRGVIGILTGGGDVPGLNPAIRAVTIRALREGYQVVGLRRGWAGLIDIVRENDHDNSNNFQPLSEELVNRAGRTGGTFLHTSRTNPSQVKKSDVPHLLQKTYTEERNDLTPEVLTNLEWLGIDYLIPIGGDDTLSYAVRLHQEGVKVVAIPKTMDNDVPGTDYCIGFSTCVTRTIQMTNSLRTSAGSHERFLVLEVFGRYAGFTAILPTMAGAANRCVIPEFKFNIEHLTELLVADRSKNPSRYSVVLVSEGAMFEGGEMAFERETTDAFGHKKLGGMGDMVSEKLKELSPKFNNGKTVDVINQKLGYLVRCGDPDAIDSIVPMAYGNLALDLILNKAYGRLVVLKTGRYDNVPIDAVTASKKGVNVKEHYNTDRLRPHYKSFESKPLFIMTSEMG